MQASFEHFQGWRDSTTSLDNICQCMVILTVKKCFPHICLQNCMRLTAAKRILQPSLQLAFFKDRTSFAPVCAHWLLSWHLAPLKNAWLHPSFKYLLTWVFSSLGWSVPALIIGELLYSLKHLCDPSLDCLQYDHVSHTAQARSGQSRSGLSSRMLKWKYHLLWYTGKPTCSPGYH